jgi:hypothetical protein
MGYDLAFGREPSFERQHDYRQERYRYGPSRGRNERLPGSRLQGDRQGKEDRMGSSTKT